MTYLISKQGSVKGQFFTVIFIISRRGPEVPQVKIAFWKERNKGLRMIKEFEAAPCFANASGKKFYNLFIYLFKNQS